VVEMTDRYLESKLKDLAKEDFPFESDKKFDDGRGNNFDPSWKDRVLNAKVADEFKSWAASKKLNLVRKIENLYYHTSRL
jgi:hypothetical protein